MVRDGIRLLGTAVDGGRRQQRTAKYGCQWWASPTVVRGGLDWVVGEVSWWVVVTIDLVVVTTKWHIWVAATTLNDTGGGVTTPRVSVGVLSHPWGRSE